MVCHSSNLTHFFNTSFHNCLSTGFKADKDTQMWFVCRWRTTFHFNRLGVGQGRTGWLNIPAKAWWLIGCISLFNVFQSVPTNGVITESKATVKRHHKTGKKTGGRSGKDVSKKSHNPRGKNFYIRFFFYITTFIPCFLTWLMRHEKNHFLFSFF